MNYYWKSLCGKRICYDDHMRVVGSTQKIDADQWLPTYLDASLGWTSLSPLNSMNDAESLVTTLLKFQN